MDNQIIPYGRQDITVNDIDAVVNVLQSDWLTQGPVTPRFESEIASYCAAKFAVAVNSATSALHIACLALGLGEGDYLWTSPITFAASSNCALYCGAKIKFIDINLETFNLSTEDLEAKLIEAAKENKLPKIVIPVHMGGQSCDMQKIYELSKKYKFSIIEDASHAIGGSYKNQRIGDCKYSNVTIFSFHPVKIITTGEGGVAVTNDKELAAKMTLLRSHGIVRDSSPTTGGELEGWFYKQIDLGFNYRMTDIQAALGSSQLTRVDQYVARRHQLASLYNEKLAELPVILQTQAVDSYSSYHLYLIRLKLDEISTSRLTVFNHMRKNGVGVNVHYIPVYYHPYYEVLGLRESNCFNAERYYSEALTLPLYPGLLENEVERVISILKNVILR